MLQLHDMRSLQYCIAAKDAQKNAILHYKKAHGEQGFSASGVLLGRGDTAAPR